MSLRKTVLDIIKLSANIVVLENTVTELKGDIRDLSKKIDALEKENAVITERVKSEMFRELLQMQNSMLTEINAARIEIDRLKYQGEASNTIEVNYGKIDKSI